MLIEKRTTHRLMNQINVVPYIDVMLVLLVIFMVTAPLINTGAVELPSVGSKLSAPVQPLEVTLRNDKSLWLRDSSGSAQPIRVSELDLVNRLRSAQQARPDQPIVIAADRAARYEEVLHVLDLLQRSGLRRVGLLARPSS